MTIPDNAHAEIALTAGTGRVVVGGHDLSNAVRSIVIRAGVGQFPELELELNVFTAQVNGEVTPRVYMPDETKQALIELGWTPPPAEAREDAHEAAVKPGIGGGQP